MDLLGTPGGDYLHPKLGTSTTIISWEQERNGVFYSAETRARKFPGWMNMSVEVSFYACQSKRFPDWLSF
jgi:hypothetical protein